MAALVSLCALTGCSNSSDVARSPSTTSSTLARTTTSTSSAPPTSSASTAVLASYRASWSAFEHALADANPSDPGLVATMVDPQLEGVKANLLADQRQGIIERGTFALHQRSPR